MAHVASARRSDSIARSQSTSRFKRGVSRHAGTVFLSMSSWRRHSVSWFQLGTVGDVRFCSGIPPRFAGRVKVCSFGAGEFVA
jgi:hypothetical protein